MKLACASGSFHRDIERGELTQLEFLDLCARELACDGVVLDVRHFPRTDDDYLAQIKKMATDRGLSHRGAGRCDASFAPRAERMSEVLALRGGAGRAARRRRRSRARSDCSWSDQLARLGAQRRWQRRVNVTLAVRNAPGTFAASTHDCKRVAKEADSAWLRFGPEPAALDAASDPRALRAEHRLAVERCSARRRERSIAANDRGVCGISRTLALDDASGDGRSPRSTAARDGDALANEDTQPHIASCARGDRTCFLAGGCGPGAGPAGISPSRIRRIRSWCSLGIYSRFGTYARCALCAVEPLYRITAQSSGRTLRDRPRKASQAA